MPALKVVAKKRLSANLTPQRVLASALASQRIEGLELDTRADAEFSALAAGKMSAADLCQRLLNRYAKPAGTNGSMSRYDGGERRLYPGTDVLINKLGIRDQAELDEAKAAIV